MLTAKMVQLLSRRLECVLELVRPCALLADVGTDHAQLPVAAVRRGLAARAVAADLREAPLRGARVHIDQSGLAGRVLALRGDGLLALQHLDVEAVVMAGMSGDSMLAMLEAAPDVRARLAQLILQPNQNVPAIRAWALRSGWHLRDERMIEERGQFFVVCAFVPAAGKDPAYSVAGWHEAALIDVGPWFLKRSDPVALRWLERQRARASHWVQRGVSRLAPELDVLEAACRAMRPSAYGPASDAHPSQPVRSCTRVELPGAGHTSGHSSIRAGKPMASRT
jgi:tRNA (adenine22-N1)-methyltransferase